MKISISNFKSIRKLEAFEIKPLSILSGVNSSGKSSFIQLLLLLKQSLEASSSRSPIELEGDFYIVREFLDIVFKKDSENKIEVIFEIDKSEFDKLGIRKSLFDGFPAYKCTVNVQFDAVDENIFVRKFMVNYLLTQGEKREQYLRITQIPGEQNVLLESNTDAFGRGIWNAQGVNFKNIDFISFFPNSYDVITESSQDSTKEGETIISEAVQREAFDIASCKSFLSTYFESISYIGPLRDLPKDEYLARKNVTSVGVSGQFAAQILETYGEAKVEAYMPTFTAEGVSFELKQILLIEALKYWVCDVFHLGRNIISKKVGETYVILIENHFGIVSTIKHVGFGISQVIPIILEGLRISKGATLILEQPEIHLHPKIQTYLFDFIYSLILSGKNVIIETHSDHFITRLRRRIAEEQGSAILNIINLTFVEPGDKDLIFSEIGLDELGTAEFFPPDFIENKNDELKAIVKAQMKKRIS